MPYKDIEKRRATQRLYRLANAEKVAEKARRWREANPERAREAARRWKAAHPHKVADALRRTRYGPGAAEFFRERVMATGGKCEVCGGSVRLCLDHSHKTGKLRGVLCSACNRTLGYSNEDANRLRGLADYIERTDLQSRSHD